MIAYALSAILGILLMYVCPVLLWIIGAKLLACHRAGKARVERGTRSWSE